MADAVYPLGKEGMMGGDIDLNTDDIRVILLKSGYTYSAAHQYVSDLTPGSYEIDRSASTMTSLDVSAGVFDAADHTISAVAGGDTVEKFVIYKYNVADSAAALVYYNDQATGLPLSTNGSDITLTWDSGGNKIFAL